MVEGVCGRCGGPNTSGTSTCQWCGNRLRPDRPWASFRSAPDRRALRDQLILTLALVSVVVVAVALVIAFVPFLGTGARPQTITVDVTAIKASSVDNVCGLNGSAQTGFVAPANASVRISWYVPTSFGSGGLPCTTTSVSATTPGFTVSANLPVTVSSRFFFLDLTILVPPQYYGPLNLTFS